MTSQERLQATLAGSPVDRPAVSFYEIGGFTVNPDDPDSYNIYNDPSWRPLLTLAEEETDLMRFTGPIAQPTPYNCRGDFITETTEEREGARFHRTVVQVGNRSLTGLSRRDPGLDTVWVIEHLIKDVDDLRAYLELPDSVFAWEPDVTPILEVEKKLGDRGIVLIDTADPLCLAASLFPMETFTMIAYTEQALFHKLLEKIARWLYPHVRATAAACPGHLWRVVGPEYATEPYLPPVLFRDYVVPYTGPVVQAIQEFGGFARLHCHGRIRSALPYIMSMGVDGLDPIEPPPQGDIELDEVRECCGQDVVLFGNIEVSDIETLDPVAFERKAVLSLEAGTRGDGRGFVFMPTACPYGRNISPHTLENYRTMVRLVNQ